MFSEICILVFALLGGIVSAYMGISVILIPIMLLYSIFRKNILINLAILIMFISGIILMQSHLPKYPEICVLKTSYTISKTLSSSYLAENEGIYHLRTEEDYFEGDKIYGTFLIKPLAEKSHYDNYLKSLGVFGHISIICVDSVMPQPGIARFRVLLLNRVRFNTENRELSALIESLILGYRNDISKSLRDMFNETGTAHFLAISGLHTGIIYLLVLSILYFIPLGKKLKIVISLLILIFFAFLTYGNYPVIRAVIFILLYEAAHLCNKKVKTGNILYITALVIISINPYAVMSLSFWLSFSAVYIIINAHRITNSMIITLLFLPVLMLPLSLYYFKHFHFLASIISLLLMPLFFIFIPLSFCNLIFHNIIINNILNLVYTAIINTVKLSHHLPLNIHFAPDMNISILLGVCVLLFLNKKYGIMLLVSVFTLLYSIII